MNKNLKKVYDYYNDDNIIRNILDPNFFGKNLWHTPLLLNYKDKVINENDFLIKNSGIKNGSNILDFGCGVGGFLRIILNQYDCNAIGVNISPKQIKLAKNNFNNEKVKFIYFKDMLSLPNNSIDIIFAQESIVHYDNKKELFSYFYKILKQNGIVIFLDWFLYDIELAKKTDEEYKTFIEPLDKYKKIINEVGFKDINVWTPINNSELDRFRVELGFTNYILKCKKYE
jgi:cyclopropane fatty-acyl-phospholipid synthase-like methyltransferase